MASSMAHPVPHLMAYPGYGLPDIFIKLLAIYMLFKNNDFKNLI